LLDSEMVSSADNGANLLETLKGLRLAPIEDS
jgi:hypothetical protein